MNVHDYGTWYRISIHHAESYPQYEEWSQTPHTEDQLKTIFRREMTNKHSRAALYQDKMRNGIMSLVLNNIRNYEHT